MFMNLLATVYKQSASYEQPKSYKLDTLSHFCSHKKGLLNDLPSVIKLVGMEYSLSQEKLLVIEVVIYPLPILREKYGY